MACVLLGVCTHQQQNIPLRACGSSPFFSFFSMFNTHMRTAYVVPAAAAAAAAVVVVVVVVVAVVVVVKKNKKGGAMVQDSFTRLSATDQYTRENNDAFACGC
jgi:4-amino-4-deoxy-L-arabinose transferase-like glycosyltransferase